MSFPQETFTAAQSDRIDALVRRAERSVQTAYWVLHGPDAEHPAVATSKWYGPLAAGARARVAYTDPDPDLGDYSVDQAFRRPLEDLYVFFDRIAAGYGRRESCPPIPCMPCLVFKRPSEALPYLDYEADTLKVSVGALARSPLRGALGPHGRALLGAYLRAQAEIPRLQDAARKGYSEATIDSLQRMEDAARAAADATRDGLQTKSEEEEQVRAEAAAGAAVAEAERTARLKAVVSRASRQRSRQISREAKASFQKGDYEKAREKALEAAKLDPTNADAAEVLRRIERLYGGEP